MGAVKERDYEQKNMEGVNAEQDDVLGSSGLACPPESEGGIKGRRPVR